jgi:hypothetical protein
MMMRYRGGGVGHKSTRDATNWFLNDRDRLDLTTADDEEDLESEAENVENDLEGLGGGGNSSADLEEDSDPNDHQVNLEDNDDTNDAVFEEEFDYGMHRDASDDEEEVDEVDEDALGPEDGDGEDDDVDLGYADL